MGECATEPELHHVNTTDVSQRPSDDSRRLSEQLLTASGKGLEKLVSLLLGRGADVNHVRNDGWTSLMAACSVGHFAVAEVLLAHNAHVAATALDGFTALLEACTFGHTLIVHLLIEHNADPCAPASDGTTPLILASLHGHLETVAMLIECKADIDYQKPDGFSPLRAACANGHTGVVKLLIEQGAALTEDGAEALVSACANGQISVARHLIEKGVPATCTSSDGATALMKACLAGHKEVAGLLVEHGADVDAVLDAARRQNSLSGVRRVLSRVKQPSKTVAAETRDLDELVRQIEGPKALRKLSQGNATRSPNNRVQERAESPKESSSASSSESKDSSNNENVQEREENTAVHVEETDDACTGQQMSENTPVAVPFPAMPCPQPCEQKPATLPFIAKPCSQSPDGPSHIFDALGLHSTWTIRSLPTLHGKAGTYYTIEVLCSEQNDISDIAPTLGFDGCVRGTTECNAAVLAARCKGWPIGELRLLPLDEAELAEALYLAEQGIPYVSAREPMQVSSPCSSASSTLPDRDAIEEYATWCLEAQRRCLQAPKQTAVESG